MKVSEFIAKYILKQGITDIFGIPGGVILEFLYSVNELEGITPHLSYNEQCAAFAAMGYAQVKGSLGVAYSTKGPGFTNMITAIADSFFESVPVLYITAHSTIKPPQGHRSEADQELDTCGMIKNIVKYAKRIDSVEEVGPVLKEAFIKAMSGRKGPVFIDISAKILKAEIIVEEEAYNIDLNIDSRVNGSISTILIDKLNKAKKPILLVGDGINQSQTRSELNRLVEYLKIPVISSRYSHNLIEDKEYYYGYIGSHGIRYSNFILSKTDFILSLGNSLNFPKYSKSFYPIVELAEIIRVDTDRDQLTESEDKYTNIQSDLREFFDSVTSNKLDKVDFSEWIKTCKKLKEKLWECDVNEIVTSISSILSNFPENGTIVADVGNNEFWVSRACVLGNHTQRTLYSKSFGALGNALGKAIGAYYGSKEPVIVFVGDQGLQLNIQELQYISMHRLPITIVVLNNESSGMIKDREAAKGFNYPLHTTYDSGYGCPNLKIIAKAYNLNYQTVSDLNKIKVWSQPKLVEVFISPECTLSPLLPIGNECQDMEPKLDTTLYEELNEI